jgi:hypothetical protein
MDNMEADLEVRLSERYADAKDKLEAPREVHRRLQFLARVLGHVPAPSRPALALLWLDAGGEVVALPIDREEIVVGRAAECDVTLDDPCVSRRHCVLRPVGEARGVVEIEDLGSSNGTKVNGRLLPERGRRLVREGDVIELGGIALALAESQPASGA